MRVFALLKGALPLFFADDPKLQKPQYKVGGYRLDFLLKVGGKDIALECDGKAYHGSEEAFAEDMQRQKILESYGYKFYRIWSTSWFRSKDREVIKLKKFIEQESK